MTRLSSEEFFVATGMEGWTEVEVFWVRDDGVDVQAVLARGRVDILAYGPQSDCPLAST